jgi:ABC-type transporter Mla subunit MlaD
MHISYLSPIHAIVSQLFTRDIQRLEKQLGQLYSQTAALVELNDTINLLVGHVEDYQEQAHRILTATANSSTTNDDANDT